MVRDPWGTLTKEQDFPSDGTQDLILPNYVKKIISITDKTNKFPVERFENLEKHATSSLIAETAGKAYYWEERGMSPVAAQPTSASLLQFDPDSAADTCVCYVEGVAQSTLGSGTAASWHTESEYVTCVSGAATSTTKNFIQIMTLGKDVLTEADVIVRYGGVNPPIARIDHDAYRSEYRHVRFVYAPSAGTEFRVKYIQRMTELTQDDQVLPPSVNPRFLVWWAAGNIHSAMGQHKEAQMKWQMAEKFLLEDAHHEKAHGEQDWTVVPDSGWMSNDY